MRIANLSGRLVPLDPGGRAVDVERAGDGWFGPDSQAVHDQWDAFRGWAASAPSEGAWSWAAG